MHITYTFLHIMMYLFSGYSNWKYSMRLFPISKVFDILTNSNDISDDIAYR